MSLRSKVLQGGTYLAIRQGLSMVIGLIGVMVLTRLIGPENYGIFAGVTNLYIFLISISQLGINTYLIRSKENLSETEIHQAFTLLVFSGVFILVLSYMSLPIIGYWMNNEMFTKVAMFIFPGVILSLLIIPPLACLEKEFNYKLIASIEVGMQVIYYTIALPLAYSGMGVWATVIGFWSQQIFGFFMYYFSSKYRPKLVWNKKTVDKIVKYGFTYSLSSWVWQLRSLVNPLIVGHFISIEAVGYIALTIRIVDALTFIKTVTTRIAMVAFSKVQDDLIKLRESINEGMVLLAIILGTILVSFGILGPLIIPRIFGLSWLKVMEIYPYLAFAYFINTIFCLHSTALYVIGRNIAVFKFNVINIIVFFLCAITFIPKFGVIGYGLAEVITIITYYFINFYIIKFIGVINYKKVFLSILIIGIVLFYQSYKLVNLLIFGLIAINLNNIIDIMKSRKAFFSNSPNK